MFRWSRDVSVCTTAAARWLKVFLHWSDFFFFFCLGKGSWLLSWNNSQSHRVNNKLCKRKKGNYGNQDVNMMHYFFFISRYSVWLLSKQSTNKSHCLCLTLNKPFLCPSGADSSGSRRVYRQDWPRHGRGQSQPEVSSVPVIQRPVPLRLAVYSQWFSSSCHPLALACTGELDREWEGLTVVNMRAFLQKTIEVFNGGKIIYLHFVLVSLCCNVCSK